MSFRKMKKAIDGLKDDVRELRVVRRPGVLTTIKPNGISQVPINGSQSQSATPKRFVALWG